MGMSNSVYSRGPHVAVFPAKCGWKSDPKHLLTTGDCRLKYIEEILIYILALVFVITLRTIFLTCCTIGAANTPITAKNWSGLPFLDVCGWRVQGPNMLWSFHTHSATYLSYGMPLECKWKLHWAVSILYYLFLSVNRILQVLIRPGTKVHFLLPPVTFI